MPYGKLGTSCTNQTIACTSAQKYLHTNCDIYKKWGMYMHRFPASDTYVNPGYETGNIIKNYYGKVYNADVKNLNRHTFSQKSCKSC